MRTSKTWNSLNVNSIHPLELEDLIYKILGKSQVWGLIPIIPAVWEAEAGKSLEVRSSKPAWETWWNPVSTKNTKLSWAVVAHACSSSYLEIDAPGFGYLNFNSSSTNLGKSFASHAPFLICKMGIIILSVLLTLVMRSNWNNIQST